MQAASSTNALSITNPLVLYRALLATKRVDPDPAQHRLAIHLQKLYERLKDYEPVVQYGHRLQQISRQIGSTPARPAPSVAPDDAGKTSNVGGILASAFRRKGVENGLALTRVLTSQEAAIELNSPRGLMLHGEVGTGKSMLIDLFADCLPNRKKKRWHYTTFMLHVLHKLETLRRSRQLIIPTSLGQEDDYSLLWLARDMISTSPILFLDEFQLPDRAAAKIMTNLMTCFFHLGGVLIATSNRMPEELAKAAGMDFAQPAASNSGVLGWSLGLGRRKSAEPSVKRSEFAAFLDVLRARCEVWEMEGGKDYRRGEAETDVSQDESHAAQPEIEGSTGLEDMSTGNVGLGWEQSVAINESASSPTMSAGALPKNYYVKPGSLDGPEKHERYQRSLARLITNATSTQAAESVPWEGSSIRVYGRDVPIPRQYAGVTLWSFEELCINPFGPADFITLASTYHTLILTDVPVLSSLQKNEARRLINLLDALYEARCKLIVTAEAGPDDIFFPEQKVAPPPSSSESHNKGHGRETVDQDAVYSETLSEIYQDVTAPFRPNISPYTEPGVSAPEEADGTHARFAGMFAQNTHKYSQGGISPADQLEDTPPNTLPRRAGSALGLDTGDDIAVSNSSTSRSQAGPNFQKAGVFTGEDEKFAYKRARSRLWEMCGGRWWARGQNAEVGGPGNNKMSEDPRSWWRPIAPDVRRWEGSITTSDTVPSFDSAGTSDAATQALEGTGSSRNIDQNADEVLFRHGASPFRTATEPPPKFSLQHFWGTVKWGRKAGRWGQGAEALGRASDSGMTETSDEYVKRRNRWRKGEGVEPSGR